MYLFLRMKTLTFFRLHWELAWQFLVLAAQGTGSLLDLTFASGTPDIIDSLFFDGVSQQAGVWGAVMGSFFTLLLTLALAANNIFDVEARRHSSLLKDYAPLAGRDLRLTARFDF